MALVDAPPGSPVHAWAASLSADADIHVFAADDPAAVARAVAARAVRPTLATIACLPLDPSAFLHIPPHATTLVDVRADAYASDPLTFAHAVAFVSTVDRARRHRGPLRLVMLGPLGMPQDKPPAGTEVMLGPALTRIGRGRDCTLAIPQGHSDQSNIARVHVLVERGATGLTVRDAATTNGTWHRGARLDANARPCTPGDELALCGLLRIRIDGAT